MRRDLSKMARAPGAAGAFGREGPPGRFAVLEVEGRPEPVLLIADMLRLGLQYGSVTGRMVRRSVVCLVCLAQPVKERWRLKGAAQRTASSQEAQLNPGRSRADCQNFWKAFCAVSSQPQKVEE